MVCTFFGHSDAPKEIGLILRKTLIDLIENYNADRFYVGNNGKFDLIVYRQLEDLSKIYPINYSVVLSYLSVKNKEYDYLSNTILPEGIETVPKRFAITWRNKWMLEQSETVITYITHSYGGAFKFKEMAERKGLLVINLQP